MKRLLKKWWHNLRYNTILRTEQTGHVSTMDEVIMREKIIVLFSAAFVLTSAALQVYMLQDDFGTSVSLLLIFKYRIQYLPNQIVRVESCLWWMAFDDNFKNAQ